MSWVEIDWTAGRLAYLLFMAMALVVFILVRRAQSRWLAPAQIHRRKSLALALAGFVGGVFGAKLPFLAGTLVAEGRMPLVIADGKTITTALVGAYLAVEIAKRLLRVEAKTGDHFALPLAVALAVGRWGCFFNGCCYGRPTAAPWGVDFLGDGLRHPTQLYESLFHATLALVIGVLLIRNVARYQRLKLYLLAYCVFRFLTEWLRPEPIWFGGLTFYQWVVLGLALFLAVQWWLDERLKSRERREPRLGDVVL